MEINIQLNRDMEVPGFISKPEGEVKKVILLIHGLGEHSARYKDWAAGFAAEGFAVVAADLPGHGVAPGRKGHIESYQVYNNLIDNMADLASAEFPGIKTGIYGHSLGGNISLNYLLTNLSGLDFAVITSPWLILGNKPSGLKMAMARVLNCLVPKLLLANGLNRSHISHVEDVTRKYSEDPLVHDRISVRLGVEASEAAERILETGSLIDIPVLLLHGSDDLICSPEGSVSLASDKDNFELKIFKDGYHELHNESFRDDVFTYIAKWLDLLP